MAAAVALVAGTIGARAVAADAVATVGLVARARIATVDHDTRADCNEIDRACQNRRMARGYSRDLRERLLTMVESGLSVAEVARRTRISQSSIFRWRARVAADQSLEARTAPGGERKIGPGAEEALRAQVRTTPDATLAEHCAAWAAAGQEPVSVSTMSRALTRLGLSLKKRP